MLWTWLSIVTLICLLLLDSHFEEGLPPLWLDLAIVAMIVGGIPAAIVADIVSR
jgi:hypothetical protein